MPGTASPHHLGKDHLRGLAPQPFISSYPCIPVCLFSCTFLSLLPLYQFSYILTLLHACSTTPRQRSLLEPGSAILVVSFPCTFLSLPFLYHIFYDPESSSFGPALPSYTTKAKIVTGAKQCDLCCVFPSSYHFLPPLYHFSFGHSGSSFDQALPPTTTEAEITNEAQQCDLGCVFSFHLSLLASFISLFLWPLPLFLHHREQRSPWKCGSATLYLQLAIDSVHSASEKIV